MRIVTAYASFDESKCNRHLKFKHPCEAFCPIHQDAQGYIAMIKDGKYKEALDVILRDNPLPSICGRVCTHPCEDACMRGFFDEPVANFYLKRWIVDHIGDYELPKPELRRAEKIAVVGSGPAGLTCAYYLAREGYQVTIFEALNVAGGMLAVGIPAYRLDKELLKKEIERIERAGVEIKLNASVGDDGIISLDDLKRTYDAVFLAVGAWEERKLDILGEDIDNVLTGLDFLRGVNTGSRVEVGKRVVVVGGGNSAVDAARTAKRLGAEEVKIIYRRSPVEMPATPEEVDEAEREGVTIQFLTLPKRILGERNVTGIECIRSKLGRPDESGRRQFIPIEGSEFRIPCDTVIVTIGQIPKIPPLLKGKLEVTKNGTISVDSVTLQTSVENIFAGGDCVIGPDVVINAMSAGRRAAISIYRYLDKLDMYEGREFETPYRSRLEVDVGNVPIIGRTKMSELPLSERMTFEEVNRGLTEEQAKAEAERCLSCECKVCALVCPTLAIKIEGELQEIDKDVCTGCRVCESRCPRKAIKMVGRDKPVLLYVDPKEVDRERLVSTCLKAGYHPEQIVCFCTGTRAEEVAAAILKGAKNPAEISRMTGIRSGCSVECIEPQIKLLDAAGVKVEAAPGWQWYGRTPSIWDIPEDVKNKFSEQFYFYEDIKLRESVLKPHGRREYGK